MGYTVKIKNVEKVRHQVRNNFFFDVDIAFANKDGEEVERRRLGLPATYSIVQIKKEVQKVLDAYNRDADAAERQKEQDKIDKTEKQAKEELVGSSIDMETEYTGTGDKVTAEKNAE